MRAVSLALVFILAVNGLIAGLGVLMYGSAIQESILLNIGTPHLGTVYWESYVM